MKRRISQILAPAGIVAPALALAQPVDLPIPPAATTEYPARVSTAEVGAKDGDGMVYVDGRGHTLYGMDMRTGLLRFTPRSGEILRRCPRARARQPLPAPPGSTPNIRFPIGLGQRPAVPATGAARSAAAPVAAGDGLYSPANAPPADRAAQAAGEWCDGLRRRALRPAGDPGQGRLPEQHLAQAARRLPAQPAAGRAGAALDGAGTPVSRVGLTLQQVYGVPVDRWGGKSMETGKTIGEVVA